MDYTRINEQDVADQVLEATLRTGLSTLTGAEVEIDARQFCLDVLAADDKPPDPQFVDAKAQNEELRDLTQAKVDKLVPKVDADLADKIRRELLLNQLEAVEFDHAQRVAAANLAVELGEDPSEPLADSLFFEGAHASLMEKLGPAATEQPAEQ